MTTIPDDEATLRAEFDVMAKRAGLHIPDERREWLFEGFKDMRKDLPLLRQPRTAAHEPAAVYSLDSITRTINR